jgi:D-cysteine desulfhydrase
MQRELPVDLPRFRLAQLPTPLHDAPRLARAIGVARLLVKRDDLTGFAGGGNKVRKLEFLVGDALAKGADTIIAVGGAQSNAVRTAMVAGRAAGLEPIAVMYGNPPATLQGNLVLDDLAGARLVFTGQADRASMEPAAEALAAELRAAGKRPYVIPRGGATPVGDAGYVEACAEVVHQLAALGADPSTLIVATGSCGTQAGLIAGAAWLGVPFEIVGILVSRPRAEAVPRLLALAQAAADLLDLGVSIGSRDVRVEDGYLGPGFGTPSPEGDAALRLALTTEGLVLDQTYTAKALAGLIGLIRNGRIRAQSTVLFVHTGGEPALYARALGGGAAAEHLTAP